VERIDTLVWANPETFVHSDAVDAEMTISVEPDGEYALVAEWVYVPVAPFPTLVDDLAWEDLVASWEGRPAGTLSSWNTLLGESTAATLAGGLGEETTTRAEVVLDEELIGRAWAARPSWTVVPFEVLEPRWKVLRLDGASVLDRDMDLSNYPLVVRVGAVSSSGRGLSELQRLLAAPISNRDVERMSVVMLTGVTALSRGTGMRIDRHGAAYVVEDIEHWLVEPDITHISSEVSFAEDCPPPVSYTTLTFCSNPSYIEVLEAADIDIVELTGNHLLDWGLDAMELTLTMYEQRGIPYYGGGWEVSRAQAPVPMTAGAHTFGFLGCNPAGPRSDWATEDRAGSAPCDYDLMIEQIQSLREQGVIPIVTLQYREEYQYAPLPGQRETFRMLAEAGAEIVSGSQAHQPQGFDFHAGAFIHYGLGNLWFDQMWSLETRQEFLDRHVFYDGQHISTQIYTAILEDYARPRPMTSDERRALLQAAFTGSGW
jgi:poly-gamma-glutamate synthesis protein (capsule biosynthesis protein)